MTILFVWRRARRRRRLGCVFSGEMSGLYRAGVCAGAVGSRPDSVAAADRRYGFAADFGAPASDTSSQTERDGKSLGAGRG